MAFVALVAFGLVALAGFLAEVFLDLSVLMGMVGLCIVVTNGKGMARLELFFDDIGDLLEGKGVLVIEIHEGAIPLLIHNMWVVWVVT